MNPDSTRPTPSTPPIAVGEMVVLDPTKTDILELSELTNAALGLYVRIVCLATRCEQSEIHETQLSEYAYDEYDELVDAGLLKRCEGFVIKLLPNRFVPFLPERGA